MGSRKASSRFGSVGGFLLLSSILVLSRFKLKLLLVPGGVVGVGEDVERDPADTDKAKTNDTNNRQSVNDVGGSNVEGELVLHGRWCIKRRDDFRSRRLDMCRRRGIIMDIEVYKIE